MYRVLHTVFFLLHDKNKKKTTPHTTRKFFSNVAASRSQNKRHFLFFSSFCAGSMYKRIDAMLSPYLQYAHSFYLSGLFFFIVNKRCPCCLYFIKMKKQKILFKTSTTTMKIKQLISRSNT
jgi:hypothetical protein